MACLDLHGRDCLVVGGGRVATEKVQGLLECDAKVTVVAPQMDDELWVLPVSKILRAFEPEDAADRFLVIAATNDRAVNRPDRRRRLDRRRVSCARAENSRRHRRRRRATARRACAPPARASSVGEARAADLRGAP